MTTEDKPIQLVSNMPAIHRKAIAFTCDYNFLPFAAHAAVQICRQHPNRDFDVCLVCGDGQSISLPENLRHFGLRLCHVDSGNTFDGMKLSPGRSHIVYLRLCLPRAFRNEYDRILYLDSDIFVQGGDFSALLDSDMGPYCIGAVRDNCQWRTPNRVIVGAKKPKQRMSRYFNSGVLLVDVAKYDAFQLMEKCIAAGQTAILNDQNLYNLVLQGEWAELSPMWNWQYTWASRLFATLYSPHIIHFIGPAKPWKDADAEFDPRFAQSYARFVDQHFPDFPLHPIVMPRLAPDSTRFTKMLVKHLISRKKIARYLARFPSDLTVHL